MLYLWLKESLCTRMLRKVHGVPFILFIDQDVENGQKIQDCVGEIGKVAIEDRAPDQGRRLVGVLDVGPVLGPIRLGESIPEIGAGNVIEELAQNERTNIGQIDVFGGTLMAEEIVLMPPKDHNAPYRAWNIIQVAVFLMSHLKASLPFQRHMLCRPICIKYRVFIRPLNHQERIVECLKTAILNSIYLNR